MRIIPAVDIMDGQVVRLLRGDPDQKTVYGDDPVQMALQWQEQGAQMLHIVDLDATLGRGSNTDIIREISGKISIPFQVAGGLRDADIIRTVLGTAPRVVIGTLAFEDPGAVGRILEEFGDRRIVISADYMNGCIVTHGWQKGTKIKLLEALQDFVRAGFSEFLITNVSRDGTLGGPDLDVLAEACRIKGASIIASGGISGTSDISRVRQAGASGVILGRALYDSKITIPEVLKL